PNLAASLCRSLLHVPSFPTAFPYTTLFRSPPGGEAPHRPWTVARRFPPGQQALLAPVNARYKVPMHALMMLTGPREGQRVELLEDRKSTRLNSSHVKISYAVFCLKKKTND